MRQRLRDETLWSFDITNRAMGGVAALPPTGSIAALTSDGASHAQACRTAWWLKFVIGAKIRVLNNIPRSGRSLAGSVGRHDHTRRNTMLRLFAGISVITGAENPTDRANAATASRSRRPQVELRSRRLRSKA